jgi:hypothetical protein
MSDRAYSKVQAQQNILLETSPRSGLLQRTCACGQHTLAGGECEECRQKRDGVLQRHAAISNEPTTVPPIVGEVLRSPGQPLDASTRTFMEPRFGQDFSTVRVHTDEKAAGSARGVNALAYTVGRDVVFGAGMYTPGTREGQRLLGHELTHVVQQGKQAPSTSNLSIGPVDDWLETQAEMSANAIVSHTGHSPILERRTNNILQRVPAPPTYEGQTGAFDRSKVQIGELPDVLASTAGGQVTLTPATLTATVAFSAPEVTHLSWELYDPSDQFVNGWSTTAGSTQATTRPFVFDGTFFHGKVSQGRYAVRCIGRHAGKPIVYADRTFYISTSTPLSQQGLKELNAIKAAPAAHSLGEVGAAYGRSMMLEHQAAVSATGTGKYAGNRCPGAIPTGVEQTDCTTYVLEVLKQAFTAKGRAADWKTVFDEAQKMSAGLFKGTELLKALINKAGWKALFWSPDPRNPSDRQPYHSVYYKRVRETGEYRGSNEATGIPVDASKSIIDYRPTSPTKQENMSNFDRLKQVPLAVIATKGGTHMTLLLNGQVYEVHWDKPATDPNVIEATPLEKWAWLSGVVVMPSEDYKAAF